MPWWSWATVLALVLAAARRTARSSSGSSSVVPGTIWSSAVDDDTFVYDAAARFNETVIGTIDAIDTALMAILAGDIAVEQMISAGESNLKLRVVKRILAASSAMFLLAGLVVVVLARLAGK